MSAYDFNPPTEEELAMLLGPEPTFNQAPPENFHANFLQRFMENLAMQGGQQSSGPQGFGGGFAGGLIGGLAAGGRRVAGARQAFEAKQAQRTREIDAQRIKASEDRRTAKRDIIRDAYKTNRAEKTKQTDYERDNPVLTQEMIDAAPTGSPLKRLKAGGRIGKSEIDRAMLKDERPTAAENRATTNQERLLRQTDATIVNQMVDDYKQNPSITAYRTAQQNLNTIHSASKEPSGFGDLAMLIAYVRATEPGVLSVVRQEELQNVGQAVGKLQQYVNIPNLWVSGQRLTPLGRQQIIRAAENIASSQKGSYDVAREMFHRRAVRLGVDPTLITQEYGAAEDPYQTYLRLTKDKK